jgi:hypothetical protein
VSLVWSERNYERHARTVGPILRDALITDGLQPGSSSSSSRCGTVTL